jgi:proline iminopeptidase
MRAIMLGFLAACLAFADDGSFTSNGLELHYKTAGSGMPIVILSGGPGLEVDYMIAAAEPISTTYQKIFLEQRGTGRSRPAQLTKENLSLKLMIDDLEALRVHLKQERLILLGHSWGGMYAMAYAAAHPDHIERMILVESGGPSLEFGSWVGDSIEARLRPEDIEAQQTFLDAEHHATSNAARDTAAIKGMNAILPGYFFDREKAIEYGKLFKDGSMHRDTQLIVNGDLATHYSPGNGLMKLNRPVLIIQSHQDPMGDKTAEDIHALISSSSIRYLNRSGHFPWIEQPKAYAQMVQQFLGIYTQ